MISTVSHPSSLSIPTESCPPIYHPQRQQPQRPSYARSRPQPQPQQRQRYRSLSGSGGSNTASETSSWDGEQDHRNANMNRRPSLPANGLDYQQQQLQQQQHQSSHHHRQYPNGSYSQQQSQPLTPLTPSNAPVIRHPLWRLECFSCGTTLCEQAMQGHLVGDTTRKLFSTNQATG